ncbi:hypothetical protein D3C74_321570 [compost metagenome]
MFFHQHPFVEFVNIDQIECSKITKGVYVIVLKYFAQLIQHLFRLLTRSQHWKRDMLKVTCDPDTTADHNLRISSITAHPVTERLLCKTQIRHHASLLLMTNFTLELFLFQVPGSGHESERPLQTLLEQCSAADFASDRQFAVSP